MKKTQLVLLVIVVILVILGVGAWYIGTNPTLAAQLGFSKPQTPARGGPNVMASSTRRFGGMRGGFVTGSIEVLNDNGFTVTLQDGTTKNVTITATTTIQNYASASSTPTAITSDQLSVGEQVFVMGIPQSDGSIAATRVSTGTLPVPPAGGYGRGMHNASSTDQ